ncbi:FecCD family ABC transporter permease [Paenibacillus eucommiae]|uniref:Iron complex transport system permease protein n=1 Tax=Paenibacillus eucommiae TaxID=1355755 RepID=A0ABS4J3I5_9BACL|nr:iron ABC transporter permease [Paenibacillus eucommiae]MBP1993671.1 iron complex transport system permease protein [Paenibacillus eucommiae]
MRIRLTGLAIGAMFMIFSLGASIVFGKNPIPFSIVLDSLTSFDESSRNHLIVHSVRIPRALIAMVVGGCLAMAGAVMQAITRNALAGPELFGVNQGAALMIVIHIFLLGKSSLTGYIGFSFLGAGAAGIIVYALGSMGARGLTPVKLILAGSTINLLFASLTQGILIFDEESLDTMRYWLAGSLTGRSMELFMQTLPFMLAGLIGTLAMGRQINLISLGEDVARGLGQRTGWIKAGSLGLVILLAGSSVAIAGPVGFVGLAVPHIARFIVGSDYRWILPYSAVFGAILLLLADVAARFIVPSQEVSAGVVTAMLGAPFLIYLAQRRV